VVVSDYLKDLVAFEPELELILLQEAEHCGLEPWVCHHVAEHIDVHLSQHLQRLNEELEFIDVKLMQVSRRAEAIIHRLGSHLLATRGVLVKVEAEAAHDLEVIVARVTWHLIIIEFFIVLEVVIVVAASVGITLYLDLHEHLHELSETILVSLALHCVLVYQSQDALCENALVDDVRAHH
jgi:hypothetical protein